MDQGFLILNRTFIKEEMQMVNKSMKQGLTSSILREMQIIITTKHHNKFTSMNKIKKASKVGKGADE